MLTQEEQWSSTMLPPTRRFLGFQEVFDRTHFHWGLKRQGTDPYRARVRRRAIADYVFTDVICDPVTGFRSADDVKREGDELFCLLYFDGGSCRLAQGRNDCMVERDRIAIWDGARPAMFEGATTMRQHAILIPHTMAKTIIPGIEDMCGLSIDGSSGLGAILLAHLRQIHDSIDTLDPQDRPAVLRAMVELVAAAFRPNRERLQGSAFRRALLYRVQDYVVANLHNPTLSARSIAATFRFSPRYLHRLFEEFGLTVGTWIRCRRLEASRNDLADSAMAGYSVTQIAMRHGFADASHFSHAFKNAFNIAPRDYRRHALEKEHAASTPKERQ